MFSGGRSSALMLYKMLDFVRNGEAVVIFQNTGKEREETLVFVNECSKQFGIEIVWLEYAPDAPDGYKIVSFETASRNGEPFAAAIDKKGGYLPNRVTRYCTQMLKIIPAQKYLKNTGWGDAKKALGIRYDEPKRWIRLKDDNYLPLYHDRITKQDVRHFWAGQCFDLGLRDYEGNCDLCFNKGKRKLLTTMAANPKIADWWIEQEMKAKGTFLKEGTIAEYLQMAQNGRFVRALDYFEITQTDINFDNDMDDSIGCFCGD